jgi:hypothetical protein
MDTLTAEVPVFVQGAWSAVVPPASELATRVPVYVSGLMARASVHPGFTPSPE